MLYAHVFENILRIQMTTYTFSDCIRPQLWGSKHLFKSYNSTIVTMSIPIWPARSSQIFHFMLKNPWFFLVSPSVLGAALASWILHSASQLHRCPAPDPETLRRRSAEGDSAGMARRFARRFTCSKVTVPPGRILGKHGEIVEKPGQKMMEHGEHHQNMLGKWSENMGKWSENMMRMMGKWFYRSILDG